MDNKYKLVIGSGSRNWRDPRPIKKVLLEVFKEFESIEGYFHGNAAGFDQYSDFILRRIGFTNIKKFPASWDAYGSAAGMIRNEDMIMTGLQYYADTDILLVAMPLENSIGTYGCINIARNMDIDVRVYDQNGVLTIA